MLQTVVAALDPRRRRDRKSYLILNAILLILFFLLPYPLYEVWELLDAAHGGEGYAALAFEIVFYAIQLVLIAVGVLLAAQRCHDTDRSGWKALFILVPILGLAFWIALFFFPGTPGPNRYGPDPLGRQPLAPEPAT
ncbi:DUF805 domain-containing protein [Ferrovibrio sp.]|uniref:DUF805 domain-containing protein n=1 Tax=Ferrovibrio sp. TaxID=1917215 RepID=UPI00261A24B3|nr:DUF805 domain-containing protein [Ferrovibrio sp.]